MHHLLPYSDSCLYWCLAYIRQGISDLRIYVAVTSPYPRERGVTKHTPLFLGGLFMTPPYCLSKATEVPEVVGTLTLVITQLRTGVPRPSSDFREFISLNFLSFISYLRDWIPLVSAFGWHSEKGFSHIFKLLGEASILAWSGKGSFHAKFLPWSVKSTVYARFRIWPLQSWASLAI